MKVLTSILLVFALFPAQFTYGQPADETLALFNRVMEMSKGKTPLEQVLMVEDLLAENQDNPSATNHLIQQLAVMYSFAGQHWQALEVRDRQGRRPDQQRHDLEDYEPADAVSSILDRTASRQIVMVNEAHHVAQHRVLTIDLLTELWEQGFRYFAAEVFNEIAPEELEKGYVTEYTGYYGREPTFAMLISRAREMGFAIVPYDYRPSQSIQQRELQAAEVIKQKIFDRDPDAKVVIHVGFSHVDETAWLAHKLKLNLNLDPLTIHQTDLMEKSSREFEHPTYTWAVSRYERREPFVFVDGDGNLWSHDNDKYDITVFWPRITYQQGRPTWAPLGRKSKAVDPAWCDRSFPCLVEVLRFDRADEVPLDRTVISSRDDEQVVFLSEGANILVVTDGSGKRTYEEVVNVQ